MTERCHPEERAQRASRRALSGARRAATLVDWNGARCEDGGFDRDFAISVGQG